MRTSSSSQDTTLSGASGLHPYQVLILIAQYTFFRLKLSEEAIKKENPEANIRPLILDLGSLAAVRTTAVEVNSYAEPLHVRVPSHSDHIPLSAQLGSH